MKMRTMLLLLCMLCGVSYTAALPDDDGSEYFCPGLGWNLGNQLDAFDNGVADENCWGNPSVTRQTFVNVAKAGFTAVRIPVTWLGHFGPAPDFVIDEKWFGRVDEVVEYAEDAGLKVIVNIHHDGADSSHWLDIGSAAKDEGVNKRIKAQLFALWTQIARHFKDKGHFLMFESMNEIHDGKWGWGENLTDGGRQYAVVNEWNQTFVDAVRATGGNNATRFLGVPGYCTNTDLTISHFRLPKDVCAGRLLVAVHFYDPYKFTLNNEYDEWGSLSPRNKGSYRDECLVDSVFRKLKSAFVDKGIPLYIGEFGCTRRQDSRYEIYRKYYLEYVCKAARSYGLSLFLWDNGSYGKGAECSGFIDHGSGAFINGADSIVEAMRCAYWGNDASVPGK
ncbi:MAG: glycoside hydrolase family 5 protein [Bacteroides sp.]|nr:glycoside hydrolase family 5 protein [Roseburia sp.]MCM1346933.1 glycoside hydrolase family 5 protein [Bacteroides sp.]MCM1421501.1 glycoside hydrolase family 5 protein [Bacteroides sp.]